MKPQRCGFTLIELLIVIAIIGILMAILFPLLSAVYRSAMEIQCQNNLGELAKAVAAYCQQNDGKFPVVGYGATPLTTASASDWLYVGIPITQTSLDEGVLVKNKIVGKTDIFFCPLDDLRRSKPTAKTLDGKGITSYVINSSIAYGNTIFYGQRRVRRYEEFEPRDFLFIEESENSNFDSGHMTPDTSKYALTARHRGGGYVSCMDGSVQWMTTADFEAGMDRLWNEFGSNNWYKQTPMINPSDTETIRQEKRMAGRWNPG